MLGLSPYSSSLFHSVSASSASYSSSSSSSSPAAKQLTSFACRPKPRRGVHQRRRHRFSGIGTKQETRTETTGASASTAETPAVDIEPVACSMYTRTMHDDDLVEQRHPCQLETPLHHASDAQVSHHHLFQCLYSVLMYAVLGPHLSKLMYVHKLRVH